MKTKSAGPTDIDEYIAGFRMEVQVLLNRVRTTIRKAAPDAAETISYQIPTFTLNGNLVHFAAHQKHIGFYPGASGIRKFQRELSKYKGAKGSVQFPLDEPIPFGLIGRIVKFRRQENLKKTEAARKRRAAPRNQAALRDRRKSGRRRGTSLR